EHRKGRRSVSTEANKIQALAKGVGGGTENRRYVILGQLAVAALIWYSLSRILGEVWRLGGLPGYEFFGAIAAPDVAAFVLTFGGLVYAFRSEVVQDFCMEVIVELRKVTWPTFKE